MTNIVLVKAATSADRLRCGGCCKRQPPARYNRVRRVMFEAARQQEVPADRSSFIDALRWLTPARAGEPLRQLIVPRRHRRGEPWVRQRRPQPEPLWHKPHAVLRQALVSY